MCNFEIFWSPNPDTGTNYEFAGPLISGKTAIEFLYCTPLFSAKALRQAAIASHNLIDITRQMYSGSQQQAARQQTRPLQHAQQSL